MRRAASLANSTRWLSGSSSHSGTGSESSSFSVHSLCRCNAASASVLPRGAAPHLDHVEARLHAHHQLASRERLDQEVVGAGFEPRDRLALARARRHQDHRHVVRRRRRAQRAQELDTVNTRHAHVADHQIGRRGQRHVAGRLAAVGHLDAPARAQQQRQHLAHVRIVLDDEDPHVRVGLVVHPAPGAAATPIRGPR